MSDNKPIKIKLIPTEEEVLDLHRKLQKDIEL